MRTKSVSHFFMRSVFAGGILGALFFGSIARAAECGDASVSKVLSEIEKNIKTTRIKIKSEDDYVANVQQNVNEMNQFSQGSVVSAMQKTMKVGFFFSSDETKARVRDFFTSHLMVQGKLDYYSEVSSGKSSLLKAENAADADKALAKIFEIDRQERKKLDAVSKQRNKELHDKLHEDLEKISEGSHASASLKVFGDTTENIADIEDQLATAKAGPKISRESLQRLEKLQDQVKAFCIPDVNLAVHGPGSHANRSPAVVERSEPRPDSSLFAGSSNEPQGARASASAGH